MAETREFTISGDQLDDAVWRSLETQQDLETLVIWGGPVTNQRLEPLRRLTWLTGLSSEKCRWTMVSSLTCSPPLAFLPQPRLHRRDR